MGFLFSTLFHTAVAAVFLLGPFLGKPVFNLPRDHEIVDVMLVTLGGRDIPGRGPGAGGNASPPWGGDSGVDANGNMRFLPEPAPVVDSPAMPEQTEGTDSSSVAKESLLPAIPPAANLAAATPPKKHRAEQGRVSRDSPQKIQCQREASEVESVPAGAKESRDVSPTAGARGSDSGAVMAGGSGDGTANGAGSDGIGQGSSMGGPFELQMGVGGGPRFVRKALPRYPRAARELGKEGTVLLRLTIDERGRLVDVEVMQKAGMGFEEEAVRAVRESKFCAASKNGNPVACRVLLPIRFVLRNSEGG